MATFLKKLRKRQKVSQAFLAQKIGLTRPTYAKIENGARDISVKEARKLATFFHMPFEDFLAGKDAPALEMRLEKSKKKPKQYKAKMRISVPQENMDTFKEVLLYILERIGARPNIGEAVVCKLLYFVDFDYYEKFETQLIGATYIKNHFGPTPVAFPEIIAQMEKDGDVVRVTKKYFQHDQKKYLPRRSANLACFSAQEKELIDYEIERFKDYNAAKMRDYSHKDVPYIGADYQQPIDYEAVFYRTAEFSVRQYENEI